MSATHPGSWQVIVVGGGHAGCEAALASARCGIATLLLTHNVDRIGWMSCNPAIGGVGKSHLVQEIDALGGEMARATDKAGLHYKLLNASRGPAVRALRVQCDKLAYATAMRQVLENQANLSIKQAEVEALWLEAGELRGVRTRAGLRFGAQAVVLTTGTFLSAVCHTGLSQTPGGRAGDGAASGLGEQLRGLGVRTLRHKTGTCPRIDDRTVNFARLSIDPGMPDPTPMARGGPKPILAQMPCFGAHTTPETHRLIRENLDRSPLYAGIIQGQGPRYCPSIEDKVVRFAHHERHALILEREGWQTREIYLSGLSTSLPADVQVAMVRSIAGLEHAEIVRFGYAVEYDAVDARALDHSLQLRRLPRLFLAGQVNGTSGYEEAAGQGLVAGLNAVQCVRGKAPLHLSRADSYLGVMVDDLVTLGADEPYRMFTARAEHRLSLRASNADLRLTPLGRELGLCNDQQWQCFQARQQRLQRARTVLRDNVMRPTPANNARLQELGSEPLEQPVTLEALLRRPQLPWEAVHPWLPHDLEVDADDVQELLTAIRYAGYIAREDQRRQRTLRQQERSIPPDLDYAALSSLSIEARAQLARVRPATLGQAARIPGVTPAAMDALGFHVAMAMRRGDDR